MTESTPNSFSTLVVGEEGHTTSILGEEDLLAHAETLRNLHPTTLALGEKVSTFAIGEEFTTEAVGEENPTAVSGEGPVDTSGVSRRGGPFGAY
jgi:hypothetical protein